MQLKNTLYVEREKFYSNEEQNKKTIIFSFVSGFEDAQHKAEASFATFEDL